MPYYIKDPKRDPNFDKHPYVYRVRVAMSKYNTMDLYVRIRIF